MSTQALIFDILASNGFLQQSDTVDCFEYKVIRLTWSQEDEKFKFVALVDTEGNELPESEEAREQYRQHLLAKECFRADVPRLVLVNYAENRDAQLSPANNMYPPIGNFSQRGMVINLEKREILYAGSSWINLIVNPLDLVVLGSDTWLGSHIQRPIEGATVSMFYYPEGDEIFIGTNRRVLKLSKIISGGGSRWNFYGHGAVESENENSIVPLSSNDQLKFDIHRGALHILVDIAMEEMGFANFHCDTEEQIIEFTKMCLKTVFFPPGKQNLVYSGIVSGKPFANQSQTMQAEDYNTLSFTLNSLVERTFNPESLTTTWNDAMRSNKDLVNLFKEYSLDISKFEIEVADVLKSDVGNNEWNCPHLHPSEDALVIYDMQTNGHRRIVKYQAPESRFREFVIRGGSEEELSEIKAFFPRHRNRKFPTPSNIRERVQQVITLANHGKTEYAFQSVDVLGTPGSVKFGQSIKERMIELMDPSLFELAYHWNDVAYSISEFSLSNSAANPSCQKMFRSERNRRVWNGLAVLYASVSDGLKWVVVDEVARYFIARMMIASVAFLPSKVFQTMVRSFVSATGFQGEGLPIGVHKMTTRVIPDPNLTNSQRKYKIADNVSKLSFLDVNFIMGFINYPFKHVTDSYIRPVPKY